MKSAMSMTVVYVVKNGLYVNLTNRCPCACRFCIRANGEGAYGSDPLWLERECREQGVTADDRDNLRFRFGDLLEYASSRFRALMSGKEENYTNERVRQILKGIMPQLEKYRFLHKVKPSADDSVSEIETIFECLPAMWHYQAVELAKPVTEE